MAVHYAAQAALALDMGKLRKDREAHLELTAYQLQRGLDARVVVEQAKGMIAATRGVELEEALTLIRRCARNHGQTVQGIASQIVARRLVV